MESVDIRGIRAASPAAAALQLIAMHRPGSARLPAPPRPSPPGCCSSARSRVWDGTETAAAVLSRPAVAGGADGVPEPLQPHGWGGAGRAKSPLSCRSQTARPSSDPLEAVRCMDHAVAGAGSVAPTASPAGSTPAVSIILWLINVVVSMVLKSRDIERELNSC